jgi:non-lysosomal glucosylceramidase
MGSPTESPWFLTNAYNFQDVSRWKDLAPKFVLQIYRDYYYLSTRTAASSVSQDTDASGLMLNFLRETYPVLLTVMRTTQAFDTDGDGMIENGGFPDQTYDTWTATGVHAYCGGVSYGCVCGIFLPLTIIHGIVLQLWIAACEAMVKVATLLGDAPTATYYSALAAKARSAYLEQLWNGRYLNFDNSQSGHHDSIMADMLAGQWYARACALPPVVPPRHALSCYRTIFQHNVVDFGEGRFIGAVNGTRPPPGYSTTTGRAAVHPAETSASPTDTRMLANPPLSAPVLLPPAGLARIDNSCMQSREVWTGTTYCLAAGMIQEARAPADEASPLSAGDRAELMMMGHRTAQGIHDGGWGEFGYWFATPEGWEKNGNYRSLGYMRALGIWAMQFAKESVA